MRKQPLLIFDLLCATVVCAVVALGLWSGLFHLSASSARADQSRAQLATTAATLTEAETALRAEQGRHSQWAADIAQRGALPAHSPVEDDLRDVARIARDSGVELVQVTPMAGEKYTGLVELRYTVQIRGQFAELLAFLQTFEQSTLWADITSLEMGSAVRGPAGDDAAQSASIVLSLFAAQETEAAPQR